MKIDKVLILLSALLALVIIAQFTVFKGKNFNPLDNNGNKNNEIRQEEKKVTNKVVIDFGDGRKIDQSLNADTAFKALEMAAGNQGYKVITKQYKYGLIVEEINKVKNTNTKFWIYTVNGEPAKIAADRFILAAGDLVEWKYTRAK